MSSGTEPLRETYPSIDLAYTIAMSSYDMAIKRFDAMDTKLNSLATFAVSVSLAFPILAGSKGVTFHSPWLAVAAIAFVIGIAALIYARVSGHLRLLDPMILHNSYLYYQESKFKMDMIHWAGKHFDLNVRTLDRNAKLAAVAVTAFAVEAVAAGAWVLTAVP